MNALDELSLSNISLISLDFEHESLGFFVNISASISNPLTRLLHPCEQYLHRRMLQENVMIPSSSKAAIHIPLNITSEDAVNLITELLQARHTALHAKIGGSIPVCCIGS
ncbi:MAG: hypothetical protein J7L98_02560 [Candidatus Verstraetearchaeota archaeon]|nr:hypothetical protein [Candidatus Verstraetearchaeota archaeon]